MFFNTEDLRDEEIFLKLERTADGQPEKKWLPAYYFTIHNQDGLEVGKCDLRIGHNEKTYVGGNIGYRVYENFRGHRYAAKACRLLFKLAEKHKMTYIIITCSPDNIASFETCELAGCNFIEKTLIPKASVKF